jgi:hypothetical protein
MTNTDTSASTDSNISANELPQNLNNLLPVGMLTSGGLIADAIAAVAQRQQAEPGWQAFHYARLDAQQFEVTGGIVELQGGVKKWPGEHSCVYITEADILAEMQRLSPVSPVPAPIDTASSPAPSISSTSIATPHSGQSAYLNLTLALPADPQQRQAVLQRLHLDADLFGARVLAGRLLDQRPD